VVLVGKGRSVEGPIHILFIGATPGAAAYPRLLIAAEADSRCTVIEEYASLHGESGFTNSVSEITLGENASLRHVRLQQESSAAYHIASCNMRLARGAKCSSMSVALGARLSRYNVGVVQGGEGADWQLDGVAVISGRQLADTHSVFDHGAPYGRSRQLHKCIAGGTAHAVFNGKILVRPGAQQTDSGQQSRNLLLSDRASIDTKPELEIFADDVKCAHGATVGQLDAEQVFYLKSRGLSDAAARNLLTFAFAAEVVERIAIPSLVARIEDFVLRQTQSKESQ
jgi:Fe-S cluster assembly protein SufD